MASKAKAKVMTLRLDEDLWKELAAVARVDEQSVSEAIREALGEYIVTRGSDPEFQGRLKKKLEEDIATAKRLAEKLGV
ncbi:MAG TPA: ribbon-helix-helix protein, CopG family [Solirubrobacterales bacterium]|nr:ribbon-helix-helix protein, CopG family [Solirubrobacterales bacterium]